jgi:hypothetical protein
MVKGRTAGKPMLPMRIRGLQSINTPAKLVVR